MLGFDEIDETIKIMRDVALVMETINSLRTREERRHWRAWLRGAVRRAGTELCDYIQAHHALRQIQGELNNKSAN